MFSTDHSEAIQSLSVTDNAEINLYQKLYTKFDLTSNLKLCTSYPVSVRHNVHLQITLSDIIGREQ